MSYTTDVDGMIAVAHEALADHAQRPIVQRLLAEAVVACVVGDGRYSPGRWCLLIADDHRRALIRRAVLRDFPAPVSSAGIDDAIGAVARAYLREGACFPSR